MKKTTISATAKALVATDIEKRLARQKLQPPASHYVTSSGAAGVPVERSSVTMNPVNQFNHQ